MADEFTILDNESTGTGVSRLNSCVNVHQPAVNHSIFRDPTKLTITKTISDPCIGSPTEFPVSLSPTYPH